MIARRPSHTALLTLATSFGMASAFSVFVGCGGERLLHTGPKGTVQTRFEPNGTPITNAPFELVGRAGVCAVHTGKVYCPTAISPTEPFVRTTPSFGDAKQAALGVGFACVTTRDGHVECAGDNSSGQLGAGLHGTRSESPVRLPYLEKVRTVRAGPTAACAIHENGTVSCWGKNEAGETGSATRYLDHVRELVEPELVPGVADVVDVAIGGDATCAITKGHETFCWGRDRIGEYKEGTGRKSTPPIKIPSLAGTTAIVANSVAFCALSDSRMTCWGEIVAIASWDIAATSLTYDVTAPKSLCLAERHGCVVDARGTVLCFGRGAEGQLGRKLPDNDTETHPLEVVKDIPPIATVACGAKLTCATTATEAHEVYCWGAFTSQGTVTKGPVKVRLE